MSKTIRTYTTEFKQDAVQYVESHPEMTLAKVAENLGVPKDTLYGWVKARRRKLRAGEAAVSEAAADSKRRICVSRMLEKLGVSKSGYYDWLQRKPSNRSIHKAHVIEAIKDIYEESKCIYGAPKITQELHNLGFKTAESTVTRYMRELGIRACWVKPCTITTHSEDFSDKLKNILKRDFSAEKPNAIWCTDITYITTKEGFVYLSCIMDLYSRKIVSWELAPTLETKYVVSAVKKAILRTGVRPKVIHTDRGIQYTSQLVLKYIDAFYNTKRIHSFCGYLSPITYENNYYMQHLTEGLAA